MNKMEVLRDSRFTRNEGQNPPLRRNPTKASWGTLDFREKNTRPPQKKSESNITMMYECKP